MANINPTHIKINEIKDKRIQLKNLDNLELSQIVGGHGGWPMGNPVEFNFKAANKSSFADQPSLSGTPIAGSPLVVRG